MRLKPRWQLHAAFPSFDRATARSKVAYIFNDGGESEITQIFKRLYATESENLLLHAGAVPDKASDWLLGIIKDHDLGFVVIDTLQRFFRFRNLNDYSEVTNAMEPFLDAISKRHCHVLFVHHAKKDSTDTLDSAVGSTALRGLCYSFIHYRRLVASPQRVLMTDQRAGKNLAECAIGFDNFTGWLKITGTMEHAELDNMKSRLRELFAVAEGPMTRQQIRNELWPVKDPITLYKALKELYLANEIERRGSGLRGSPFRYVLNYLGRNDADNN